MSMARVFVVGLAGDKAHARESAGGAPMVRFSVGVHRVRPGGEIITDWHECVAFGRAVEPAKSIRQGDLVILEGRLEYLKDAKGGKRASIVADRIEVWAASKRREEEREAPAVVGGGEEEAEEW